MDARDLLHEVADEDAHLLMGTSLGDDSVLGLRDDQVHNNIMVYGNTTAATIPIALDECVRAGRVGPGDLVVLTAFGSGFLWGSAAIRW